MDPGGMMNEAGPYNLVEIWQFPMNGGAPGDSGMRGGVPFGGPNMAQHFVDSNLNGSTFGDPARLNHAPPLAAVADPSSTRKRRDVAEDESAKVVSTSNANGASDGDSKRQKTSGCGEEGGDGKAEAESGGKGVEQKKQPSEPPKDYIHVRARRGQATDSHSLAERARREKISERMKILQDLVPGCNKVIGKALVLDEIINYIQSLQRQVEFLSMKLEAVNSRMNPGIEFGQQLFENPGMQFGSQPTREYSRGASPEWLHMQIGGGFERTP